MENTSTSPRLAKKKATGHSDKAKNFKVKLLITNNALCNEQQHDQKQDFSCL
jgi:hypothetical protein